MRVSVLSFLVPEELYTKNPTSSEVGKKILCQGLELLAEIGLEEFTFKKLANKIESTESTIYRYFENKNQFLFYLFNYYWSWMEFNIELATSNISDPKIRLRKAIEVLTKTIEDDPKTAFIDESKLQQVILVESSKIFLTKKVDEENKLGYFSQYKQLVTTLSELVQEINPKYPYPRAIVSTVIEGAFHQRFFAEHLPKLTDNMSSDERIADFYYQLCIQSTTNYQNISHDTI